MKREKLRAKLDTLSRQKAVAERFNAPEERRHKSHEPELSHEKFLAHYRDAVPEGLGKMDGKERRTVYNALGTTVWAAKAKGDQI